MTIPADGPLGAEGLLDDADQAILDRLAVLDGLLDPPPAGLDEQVSFAIALESVDAEVARLSEQMTVGSGARGSERTHSITFEAGSRTVLISIVARPDGQVRIDGWLAPAAALQVELRLPEPVRFVFDRVPRGIAQLLVQPPPGGTAPRVVTPAFTL